VDRLLVFSRTTGFRHDSIPAGAAALRELGEKHGFRIDHTEDPAAFTDPGLARYAAVVWLQVSGDVLDDAARAAYERYTRRGGGFAGIHAASTAELGWPFYGDLVGARFRGHPPGRSPAVVRVDDDTCPSTRHLPRTWRLTDEWYSFDDDPRDRVRVLLSVDESSYDPGDLAMGDGHPIAWKAEKHGARAWYSALGHAAETYADPLYRRHLLGGLQWVIRGEAAG
jgi:type 1 glutamine amidotransferase